MKITTTLGKTLMILLTLGGSLASASELSYESKMTAEVLVRQVIEKDLLPESFQKPHQVARLKAALEGSSGKMEVAIQTLSCERSLGSDECSMDIYSRINNDDAIEQLSVRIYQGKVISAEMENVAD